MNTVIFNVRSLKASIADVKAALKSGIAQETAQINFVTPELMHALLTPKRWDMLKALCGRSAVTFAEAAELVGCDVNEVHADLTALIKAGVVDREAEGVIFPYEVCCYASDRTSRSLKHCEFMEMP